VLLTGFAVWWMQAKGVAPWAALTGTSRPAPQFVGSEACAECHKTEAERWRSSQHAHAMEVASAQSVRGDFSGDAFEIHGVRSRFFRDA
jgi:formate-dependent nitrite reductase cytochrome c552 subunit